MASDIKALRSRIKGVNSTLHLTRAMGLVASSKIRRANEAMLNGREYAQSLGELVDVLSCSSECKKSPYMRNEKGERICLVAISGDRGMAGGYNANIFRLINSLSKEKVIPIGKRAHEIYGGKYISSEYFTTENAVTLAETLCNDFVSKKFDKLGIVSTEYKSVMIQQPTVKWVLPLLPKENVSSEKKYSSVIFEPDEITVFKTVIPSYIAGIISVAVRESFACEVTARRLAMDSAGKNAEQMINELQLQYNRSRQGSITQEITEIVAGSNN